MGTVDFREQTCMCMKFQHSHISCMQVVAVARHMRFTNVYAWVYPFYITEFYHARHGKVVNPLRDQSEWLHAEEERVIL